MSTRTRWTLCCLLWTLACGGHDAELDQAIEQTGPAVGLDEQLLLISGPARKAFLLDVARKRPAPSVRPIELPYGALFAQRRREHDEALVLCAGRRDSADARAEPATLSVIESDGGTRNYELGATPFDTLTQSDDGRFAVLYRSRERQGRTLQNVNELVVVDLDQRPSSPNAVTSKTPEGLAHAFTRAVISPEIDVAGEPRRLLLLLSAAEITIFDLGHLERRGTIVELAQSNGRMAQPSQVLFGTGEPALYVRGDGADDVFVFRLEPRSSEAELNDFRPTINPLGAGSVPKDIALFGPPGAQQLLVVSQDLQARVIDPRSGKTQLVTLPFAPSRVWLFEAAAPGDSQVRQRALLYSDKGQTVVFMDLQNLSDRPERRLEVMTLPAEVKSLIELERSDTLVATHAQGVTILDLQQRTATPIMSDAPLENALFDARTERLWVATKSEPWVGTLDLVHGETGEVLLDEEVREMVPFFDAGRLAILHPSSVGYVTFVDTSEPDREHASSLRGFLLSGVLDGGK
ncbi:MAG TPA: hypothetical protein VJR89_42865 [Polyangiales bacterium]|nr:hypothetical protein [Polyangiales bacterium]